MGKIVAFIPVRGGSKGIPNKNIKLINKKPLVHWVIEAALGCNKIHDVYISTDSSAIADKVNLIQDERLHVINRSKETSTDQATTESAMLEFAEHYEFDKVILIQATSPLLQSDDLVKLSLHCLIQRLIVCYQWLNKNFLSGKIITVMRSR
jgi:CMP-N-acetylneuraminic acid synthetase